MWCKVATESSVRKKKWQAAVPLLWMHRGPSKSHWHYQREHFYEKDNPKIFKVCLWREGYRVLLSKWEQRRSTGLWEPSSNIYPSFWHDFCIFILGSKGSRGSSEGSFRPVTQWFKKKWNGGLPGVGRYSKPTSSLTCMYSLCEGEYYFSLSWKCHYMEIPLLSGLCPVSLFLP